MTSKELNAEGTKFEEQDQFLDSEGEEDDGSFRISGALDYPEALTLSMREIHSQIHEGLIELSPAWQRDVVWSDSKQSQLIHSIFHNFYVPPVVFASMQQDGEEVYVCVDGKQRVSSIVRFIDGQIPYRDPETNKKWYYTTSRSERMEIPPAYKKYFDDKVMTCVKYVGLDEPTVRNMFQLVQLGVSLTSAEKLQAIHSPRGVWIANLQKQHVEVDGGLQDILDWDTKRGRGYQCLTELVFCCQGYPEPVKPSATKIAEFMSRTDEPTAQFQNDIEDALRLLWNLAKDPKFNEAFTKVDARRLAPVEFVYIAVLLYVMRDQSKRDCADAIYNLRVGVRREHADVRSNSKVWNTMWKLVSNLQDNPRHMKRDSKRKRKSNVVEDPDFRAPKKTR